MIPKHLKNKTLLYRNRFVRYIHSKGGSQISAHYRETELKCIQCFALSTEFIGTHSGI